MANCNAFEKWPRFGLGTADLPHRNLSAEKLARLMTFAMARGVKLFDTAANYHEGRAELCLSRALANLSFSLGAEAIGCLTVVTKVGQLTQGEYDRRKSLYGMKRLKHYDFSKDYIQETLQRSIERLARFPNKYVLLHNIEDIISDHSKGLSILDYAFGALEQAASDKLISGWGVSSWSGLYAAAGSQMHVDLATLLIRLSKKFGTHHFQIVQAPMGLWNLQQFNSKRQKHHKDGQPLSLLNFCKSANLQLMLNGAFDGGRWSPKYASDPDVREASQDDILRLCQKLAPTACRIVGASQATTIDRLRQIYDG